MTPVEASLAAIRALAPEDIDPLVRAALEEDLGAGDRTTEVAIEEHARATGRLIAKAPGILAGLDVFARTLLAIDPTSRCEFTAADGDAVEPGQEVARVAGSARGLLTGERTALNFLQRMSGIATLTASYVAAADGRARILDTRKTTPGLRLLEKYAVTCGGGENHRFGLDDEAMLKDNHLDLAGRHVMDLVRDLRERFGADYRVTVEARDAAEAIAGAVAGADVVMLDNLSPAEMAVIAPRVRAATADPVEIEASGGITLANVAEIAVAGVDRISIGALTHSAPALDLSLLLEKDA